MASTGEVWKLGHRPALDGVRGLAILLVIACHGQVPGLAAAGSAGVTVFFVLSGFLITSLLVEEHTRSGTISLRRFFGRRVRRLAPAFVASSAVIALVGATTGAAWFFQWRDLAAACLYVGNWVLAGGGDLGAFGGTWSLAVEEQFYLAWPLIVLLALRRGRANLAVVAGGLLLASLLLRGLAFLGDAAPAEVYYRPDMSMSALAAGALLAVLVHTHGSGRPAATVWLPVGCLLAASTIAGTFALYLTPLLAAAGAVMLLHRAIAVEVRWLSNRMLTWFGRRSYGLYLWHIVPAWVLRERTDLPWPLIVMLMLAFGMAAAELSWRFVEHPALRPRSRLSEERDAVEEHAGGAASGRDIERDRTRTINVELPKAAV